MTERRKSGRDDAGQPRQLVLQLPLTPGMGPEDFMVTAANADAFAALARWPDDAAHADDAAAGGLTVGAAAAALVLVGPAGSGKSHLAEIWRLRHDALRATARDLAVEAVPHLLARGALVLEDLPPAAAADEHRPGAEGQRVDGGAVADASAPWPEWERALFHLLNMARQEGAHVLMTARTSPPLWPVALPDLRSRLAALPVVTLQPPDDALLRAVLVKLFMDRQLMVPEEVVSYLLTRMERSLAAAGRLVARLDEEALAHRRRITRPLAAQVLRALQRDAGNGGQTE